MDVLAVHLRLDPEQAVPRVLEHAVEVGVAAKHKHHRTIRLALQGVEGVGKEQHRRQRQIAGAVDLMCGYDTSHVSQHSKPGGTDKARGRGSRYVPCPSTLGE